MARMHSRDKGKSKSYKPLNKDVSSWMTFKPKEIEMLIVKLAKSGESTSKIGLQLRDLYGIPDVKSAIDKTITKVLEEKDLMGEIPEDLMNLLKKEVFVRKHMEKNNHDMDAKRGLNLT